VSGGQKVRRNGGPPCRFSTKERGSKLMARFFIDGRSSRSCSRWFITLAGGLAVVSLPNRQYPPIAPPTVQVSTTYPGASPPRCRTRWWQVIGSR